MTLGSFGEFNLIEFLKGLLPVGDKREVIKGIGDDCAVIHAAPDLFHLFTTDSLVEEIHFNTEWTTATQLGYKSLVVNISDIAAMGGKCSFALMSLALPKSCPLTFWECFAAGVAEASKKFQCPIVGGDLVESPNSIFINFCVKGEVHPDNLKLRSGARPGDILCLTGGVGDSGAGLQLLRSGETVAEGSPEKQLITSHLKPSIHAEYGSWMGKQRAVHALIDVSDGLAGDAYHIAKESDVGLSIDVDQLSISPSLEIVARKRGWDLPTFCLNGGEDYCLLCAVDRDHYSQLASDFEATFSRPLQAIGEVVVPEHGVTFHQQGNPIDPSALTGYNHFS